MLQELNLRQRMKQKQPLNLREQQLQTELTLAAAAVEADGADYLARVRDTAERLTWVASDGAVLYDTRTDTQPMENHGQREEIREALTGGSGSSARYSETLTEKMLYQAVRLTDGSVLRISGSQKTVWMLVLGMLHAVIVVALLAVGLSALLASRAARRVVEPLNRLDLEHPLDNNAYQELSTPSSRRSAIGPETSGSGRTNLNRSPAVCGKVWCCWTTAGASSASIRRPKHCFMRTVPA